MQVVFSGAIIVRIAAERVDVRKLGAASLGAVPTLQVDYDYFDWNLVNGQGRLKRIQAGTPGSPASLLDLRYYTGTNTPKYDAVGNLLNIYDYKTGNPQTQSFGYDALDRLTSASADGSTGNYSEAYSYDLVTGNLAIKAGVSYGYDPSHPHSVTHLGGVQKYGYDSNDNMTQRTTGAGTYNLAYDAENRLSGVSGAATAAFVYDGDGRRVKGTVGGVTTTYIGNYFEWSGSAATMKKYYYAGGTRIAVRDGAGGGTAGLLWLVGDHLGSTSVVANSSGGLQSRVLYKAWGEPRYASASLPTQYTYTEQYSYTDDITTQGVTEGFGLMFYNARWYDPALGGWNQSDSIIPDPYNPLDWDRYTYARNNPVKFTDPNGHKPCELACDGETIDTIAAVDSLKKYTGLRWNGLSKEEQRLLRRGGWNAGSFNDHMDQQTSRANFWHDPLTYLEIVVGGAGLAKAGYNLFYGGSASAVSIIPTGLPKPVYDELSDVHVYPRHNDLTQFLSKSKFLPGEGGQAFADEVFDNATTFIAQNDGFIRVYADLQRVVGTRGETWGRIVIDSVSGWVKTQFPQFPFP
jgi:RHS repeat-associated protein